MKTLKTLAESRTPATPIPLLATAMDEKPEKKSRRSEIILSFFVLLPVLYVLSFAPIVTLVGTRYPINGDTIHRIYDPVIWLHGHTFLQRPLKAYAGLWAQTNAESIWVGPAATPLW
ncbi:MAG: hypothetical protein ABIS50_22600 [Luteolibacter sp.]|uniref:hypothetical protein n=2 Tax=Luteolibacter sp. TaxID=1962973 RepID=UPI0032647335